MKVRGRWDHDHAMFVQPRTHDGLGGVHVVSPLIRENGSTILVDRGFVANNCENPTLWREEIDEVEVIGLIRQSQDHGRFQLDNDPATETWHWLDVDGMAAYIGGEAQNVQPVLIQEIFGKVVPLLLSSINCEFYQRVTGERWIPVSAKASHLVGHRQWTYVTHTCLTSLHGTLFLELSMTFSRDYFRYSLSVFTAVMFLSVVAARRRKEASRIR